MGRGFREGGGGGGEAESREGERVRRRRGAGGREKGGGEPGLREESERGGLGFAGAGGG